MRRRSIVAWGIAAIVVAGLAWWGFAPKAPVAKEHGGAPVMAKEHAGQEHGGITLAKEHAGQEHGGIAVAKEHAGQEHGGSTISE